MYITDSIKYVGVNDHDIDLFEGQFIVPEGMAYNSYAIIDEKIAVMDSVDEHFTDTWNHQVKEVLDGRTPDYLVMHHMECDHSGSVGAFVKEFPNVTLVATASAFNMLGNMFTFENEPNKLVVKDGDTLSLGEHNLTFTTTPMVHWPEVMMSYESKDKVLFSADAFGKFGANDVEDEEGWACEARRYYFGIVGKFGTQVQAALKKLSNLDIQTICPLHGPVLNEDLSYYLNTYNTWSSYEAEDQGVVIVYTSVYGHTKEAALSLAKILEEKQCAHVSVFDAVRDDVAEIVEDAFRYDKLVLATTTYNTEIFPNMKFFIDALKERNYQKRTIALIENGTWAPMAAKVMKEMVSDMKDVTLVDDVISIKTSLTNTNLEELDKLADALL